MLVFLTLCKFLLKKVNPFLILASEDMAQPPYRVGCDLHGAGMSLTVSSHGIWGPQRCDTTTSETQVLEWLRTEDPAHATCRLRESAEQIKEDHLENSINS